MRTVPLTLGVVLSEFVFSGRCRKTWDRNISRSVSHGISWEADFARVLLTTELRRRAEAELLEPTLAKEAAALRRWANDTHPSVSTPSLGTIENSIRSIFWELREKSRRRTNKATK